MIWQLSIGRKTNVHCLKPLCDNRLCSLSEVKSNKKVKTSVERELVGTLLLP